VIRKSRMAVALGLVLALGVATIAYADGASDNEAFVDGNVKPSKLDKNKYKPINLLLGVRTEAPVVNGAQQNPEAERISMGKNVKWNGSKAPVCPATVPIETPGLTAQQARDMCPGKSLLGAGEAEVNLGAARVSDVVVQVFNGPGKNEVRLHTSSVTLGAAAPTVFGEIIKSDQGGKYGPMLLVADAPDAGGDAFMITKFNANIEKRSKVATARCKAKKFLFLREVTYDDGSTETAELKQKCKRKGGKK
jgi:hypothetical protein